MMNKPDPREAWPSTEDYGRRYDEINQRLARSFVLAEYRGNSDEDVPVLQYRLAKLLWRPRTSEQRSRYSSASLQRMTRMPMPLSSSGTLAVK